jgi:hypothetical protein
VEISRTEVKEGYIREETIVAAIAEIMDHVSPML